MLILALALDKIVGRAQAYINARTQAINELRKRIESFVSLTAVDAALNVDNISQICLPECDYNFAVFKYSRFHRLF